MDQEFFLRTNVLTRRYNKKDIVIYDDHRWILNVLFHLFKTRQERPNIIYFDSHDDAAPTKSRRDLLKQIGVKRLEDATDKEFLSFVEYDLRTDDSNWLLTAMELNLLGDAMVIGNRYNDNIKDLQGEYKTESGETHLIFELHRNLNDEFGERGKIGDRCLEDEYGDLREFLRINKKEPYQIIGKLPPFILDFDLDFFTIESDEGSLPWTDKIFNKYFPRESNSSWFLQELIQQAQIITICREPDYCGSLGNSNKIIELVDRFIFSGSLGATPTI